MLRRLGVCLSVVAALLLSLAVPANAGGWWSLIDLESDYLVVGRTVQAQTTDVMFSSLAETEQARDEGHFFAYLLRGYAFSVLDEAMTKPEPRHWWKLEGARPTLLGEVTLSVWDSNLATATATFTVPDIGLGTYALMFCTAGCVEPLADLIPIRVTLVADPETARLAQRSDRLDARLDRVAESSKAQVGEAMADARQANTQAGYAIAAVRELHATIDTLHSDLQLMAGELARQGSAPETPWAAFLGWFLGGAATMLLVVMLRRRRRATRIDTEELERWLDESERPATTTRPSV